MKCPLGISNFLEEISSLSHSVVFLYFFALIAEEGFLISPGYSLELCIEMGISFLFSLLFASLHFTAICKASSDNHFAFLHFFSMGMENWASKFTLGPLQKFSEACCSLSLLCQWGVWVSAATIYPIICWYLEDTQKASESLTYTTVKIHLPARVSVYLSCLYL